MEIWMEIPETSGQYQVSNLGHVRLMFRMRTLKKKRKVEKIKEFVSEAKTPALNIETNEIGWFVYFDGRFNFISREELMKRFAAQGVATQVDVSLDACAIAKGNEARARRKASEQEGAL